MLAFTEITSGATTGALCVIDVTQVPPPPATPPAATCTAPDPTYLLDRPTWDPSGLAIETVALNGSATPPTPVGVRTFASTTAFTGPWTEDSTALTLQGMRPTFIAWSPALQSGALFGYAVGPSLSVSSSAASPGTPLPPYSANVPDAFAWRADGDLVVGGLDCSAGPPAMYQTASTATATPVALSVSGCDPSVQPLGLVPPS
jgi:hypothetical protein